MSHKFRKPKPISEARRAAARVNGAMSHGPVTPDGKVKSSLNAQGFELVGGTPEDFANLIRSESEKWAPVIKKTGAKID